MNRNKILLGASLIGGMAIGLVAYYNAPQSVDYSQANILESQQLAQVRFRYDEDEGNQVQETQSSAELNIETTDVSPESPDFLNTFNIFKDLKSERAWLAVYGDLIKGNPSLAHALFTDEVASFVDRISGSDYVSNKLPMWPEYNRATFGNVLAYLFPQEPNPMLYAKGRGLVAMDAKSGSYMSKAEVLHIISRLFIDDGLNPAVVLTEAGLIKSPEQMEDQSKDGFLLVDALRLVLDIREYIERENIQASKALYRKGLVNIDQSGLNMDSSAQMALLRAFSAERNPENPVVERAVREAMSGWFAGRESLPVTSDMITEARNAFYEFYGEKVPAVYMLPAVQLMGDCNNQLFRKSYMGPVAVTGPKGANIICDKVMFRFPANSYLLNVFSLPKVTTFADQAEDAYVVRTDVMRTYSNAVIADSDGELKTQVVFRPEGLEQLVENQEEFEVVISDHEGNQQADISKLYQQEGGRLNIHLRTVDGDHMIYFKK